MKPSSVKGPSRWRLKTTGVTDTAKLWWRIQVLTTRGTVVDVYKYGILLKLRITKGHHSTIYCLQSSSRIFTCSSEKKPQCDVIKSILVELTNFLLFKFALLIRKTSNCANQTRWQLQHRRCFFVTGRDRQTDRQAGRQAEFYWT
jgi:hypothetical protein